MLQRVRTNMIIIIFGDNFVYLKLKILYLGRPMNNQIIVESMNLTSINQHGNMHEDGYMYVH
jgi:hypothetical protein